MVMVTRYCCEAGLTFTRHNHGDRAVILGQDWGERGGGFGVRQGEIRAGVPSLHGRRVASMWERESNGTLYNE